MIKRSKELPEILGDLYDGVILAGYMGSISHGTNLSRQDPSYIEDKDVMAVKIYPLDNYFGLQNKEGHEFFQDEWDIKIYDIKKYFRLLSKCNPNVLGLLWLNDVHYLEVTELGQRMIDNRNLFSSQQAYNSFVGYAHGQLHRMTHYGKYQGYMGAKRKELVDKFGYDVKNACHLIRLLNMGYEFLLTGSPIHTA